MKNVPPRPLRSSVELAAISKYIEDNDLDWEPNEIARCCTRDGFELLLELKCEYAWDICREDLDTLDEIVCAIDEALQGAEENWWEDHDVGSKALPDGTHITIGVITDVYDHRPACYRVKTPDCKPDSHRIIKFEDAIPL